MRVSRRSLIVEWGDCDPANIVFNPRYFAWFDASTMNHFNQAGLPKQDMIKRFEVQGYALVDTQAKFYIPSTFGDEITIETEITEFGRSSFNVEHRLMRGDKLAVLGHEKRVLVRKKADGKGLESCPIPAEIISLFQQ